MKKIFAIALALVMVLSMASAFAANSCSTFDWTCSTTATKCGKAKVEVVPYVLVNNGCGGTEYQVSTCATAISTQNVFFAVKLTIEANADQKWLDEAEVDVTCKGVNNGVAAALDLKINNIVPADKKGVENVFYLDTGAKWVRVDDNFEFGPAYVHVVKVDDARKAKVCATLTSDHNGVDTWKVGDYTVEVGTNTDVAGAITITKGKAGCESEFTMAWEEGKVTLLYASSDAFFAEVVSKFNLAGCVVGTCVDKDIIKRNFGWDDKFESCFSWSDKGASVVNPECVVTLPKTGDASLLWWLF